ncbi:hypothetical protein MSAN_02028700 [Mycena sanguinolenta]|uniref:Uncharacterized protein n=1 Tax=Mycena sanguinolenta TaxID=230812 RepID=A0A8H6XJH5_9AGAR|nr:hypothetical protein MSAN_02028700 [Mycena sanguinolenta]
MLTKKKPGKPSDFQGKRAEFLSAFYPKYADASRRIKTRGIWDNFFLSYWAAFPWRLPLSQDPDPEDSTDYTREPATPEEENQKNKIIAETETKIKLWLGRRGKAAGMKENPWAPWLTRFRTPATAAPRKLVDYQYYMQHEDYKGKVTARFDEEKASVSARDQLNLRTKIAREMLASETEEVRARIKEGAAAEHTAQLAKHENALEGLPALDEEGLEEARARFSGLVGPLLDGLAAHTGYEISLLVGRPKLDDAKMDIECLSMHAGVTADTPAMLDFSRADSRTYAEVMRTFSRFVWGVHEYRSGKGTEELTIEPQRTSEQPEPTPTPLPAAAPSTAAASPVAALPSPPAPTTGRPSTLDVVVDVAADVSALTVPTNTFSDEEVRALVNLGDVLLDFDEFNFSDDLMSTVANISPAFPGLGLPMPSDLYSSGFSAELSKELILRLKEMSEEEREAKIEKLRTMDALAIERENNAARNHYMLYSLGLGGQKKKAKTAKKARMEQELENNEQSNGSGESDTEPEAEEQPKRKERSTRATKGASSAWAETAAAVLSNSEYGNGWTRLVSLWWKREESANFEGTTKSHPARIRPKEVGDWVSRARNYTPQIGDAVDFGKRFWAWWIQINPSWRTKERPMKKEGEMTWSCLDIQGQNGFLNVLMCLKWWRDAMDVPSPDWEEARADVTWVLEQMSENVSSVAAASSPAAPVNVDMAPGAHNSAEGATTSVVGMGALHDKVNGIRHSPTAPARPKPRPLRTNFKPNRESPREPESTNAGAEVLAGTEGLSQEELDEINGDPYANMDEEDE